MNLPPIRSVLQSTHTRTASSFTRLFANTRTRTRTRSIHPAPSKHMRMKRNFQMFSSAANANANGSDADADADADAKEATQKQKPLVIIIAGPTAVGKSAVAAKLCSTEWSTEIVREHARNNHNHRHLNMNMNNPSSRSDSEQDIDIDINSKAKARGHIISADSVQVYKGVQIGANKPTAAEREETPHHLIDIVDGTSVCQYNAADWMRDSMQVLDRLKHVNVHVHDESESERDDAMSMSMSQDADEETTLRKARIEKFLSENNRNDNEVQVLPVIVGGTMMYLQWLVHGRPDAMKPSQEAVEKAASTIAKYESIGDCDGDEAGAGWDAAVDHTSSLGSLFADRVAKLPGRDWYRLRRTLEVAYTVLDDEDTMEEKMKQLYKGQRQGGLDASPAFDVRCFFLCPDDRMAHTAVVDSRCEQMLSKGLLKETTDLYLSGQLPEQGQQARAIGYRQTLDYLKRDNFSSNNSKDFGAYLHEFTTSTRRYAKKQMQWFRKDDKFMFVPVQIAENSTSRVDAVARIIKDMCIKPRVDFEMELIPTHTHSKKKKEETKAKSADDDGATDEIILPLSARTKLLNEKQGQNMKFYQNKRHVLTEGSHEYASVIKEADECTSRMQLFAENKIKC
jgi:tRNA dimethylallyltransferase